MDVKSKLSGIAIATLAGALAFAPVTAAKADSKNGSHAGKVKCMRANACKGKSKCSTKADHKCKGQNSCKGKGWIYTKTKKDCIMLKKKIIAKVKNAKKTSMQENNQNMNDNQDQSMPDQE